MSERCTECGALLPAGRSCQAIFDEFLSLEFTDAAYSQVHFLTVSCFMIQHKRYSDEALVWIQQVLRTYLTEQLSAKQVRQRAATDIDAANRAQRSWKITRQVDASPLPDTAWSMTIVDVAQNMHDAETYCAQITHWAETILQQLDASSSV